ASASLGLGTSDLERLVILSPTNQVPTVSWKRDRITVHPREGWKPNRVYRVELLPGLFDLRQNRSDSGAVITFTTGAPLPTGGLRGQAIDWVGQKLGRGALIEAVLQPDSLIYRAVADSSGRFSLTPLPRGEYLVYAVIDQVRNLRRDPREAFDSVRVGADSTVVPALWIVPHDTLGPRIQAITPNDSVSATVAFTMSLDPYQRMDTSAFHLSRLPDSTPVPVRWLLPKATYDSIQALVGPPPPPPPPRPDSLHPPPTDSLKAGKKPSPSIPPRPVRRPAADTTLGHRLLSQRPPLTDRLVLRALSGFTPGAKYLLEIDGIRSVNGVAAPAHAALAIPVPKAVKPAEAGPATPADSLPPKPSPDSTKADSAAAPPRAP
ncbi:MAG: Ig-like domain-containing protein, partial [Gemmatimonadales bacterium]